MASLNGAVWVPVLMVAGALIAWVAWRAEGSCSDSPWPTRPRPKGYEGETCRNCGGVYDRCIWWADDTLWSVVTGWDNGEGLLCPPCFAQAAEAGGVPVRWRAEFLD